MATTPDNKTASATSFTDALNARSMRPFQWAIVFVCMLVLVCDGIDLQLLGIVAPKVIESFGTDKSTFGIAAGAALVGFGIGSFAGGWLGDAIGRRWTLAIAALVFGLATVGAGSSESVQGMAAWRIIGGLGFGGAYANALAMASEWVPDRWRAVVVSTLSVGTPLGGTIAGWIGPDIADKYGWEWAFYIIGIATLPLALVIIAVLRDSPSFLLARGRKDAAQRNAKLVLDDDITLVPERHETDRADGGQIGVLDRSNLRLNIGVGIGFAAAALVAYSILTWTTTMLTERGFELEDAGNVVALAGITSMAGSILVGLAMRQFGSKPVLVFMSVVLVGVLIALGGAVASLPQAPDEGDRQVVIWLTGASGAFFSATIAGMYVMMTHAYPQSCRSAGIGFGIFMSRIGAISGTALGGALLAYGGTSATPFFTVLVVAASLIGVAAFVVDRHVPALAKVNAASGQSS